jgi:hypothetical protein
MNLLEFWVHQHRASVAFSESPLEAIATHYNI